MKRVLFLAVLLQCQLVSALDNFSVTAQYTSLSFVKPSDAVLRGGVMYVTDAEKDSLFLLREGQTSPQIIGGKGSGASQFDEPAAVAVGRDGRVYVADSGNKRIQVLSSAGEFLFSFGSGGSAPGQFSDIADIASSPDGRIYVADSGNKRIQFFSEDGIFAGYFKTAAPAAAVAADISGSLYYLAEGKLYKLSGTGEQLWQIQVQGERFCVDAYGLIYTLDAKRGKIRIYSQEGLKTGEFGTSGQGSGQFYKPTNIAASGENILVVDAGNRQITSINTEDSSKQSKLPPPGSTNVIVSGPAAELPLKVSVFAVTDAGLVGGYTAADKKFSVYDKEGKPSLAIGETGKKPGQYREPSCANWSQSSGWILSDTGNDRLSVFSADGKFSRLIGAKSKGAGEEGVLDAPSGSDINDQGQLIVADRGKKRLVKFNAAGMFMQSYGPKISATLELSKPVAAVWGPESSILVLDAGLNQVLMLDQAGQLVNSWGGEGRELWQLQEPVSLAYDGKRFVYVLDRKAAAVKVFDTQGKWQASFFAQGQGRTEIKEPSALVYKNDKLYISEPERGRLSVFPVEISVAPPQAITASANEDSASLSWKNPAAGLVSGYVVYRSTRPGEGYAEAARTAATSFTETLSEQGGTYYYQLAAQSRTGELSVLSQEITLFVPGIPKPKTLEISKVDIDHIFSAGYKYYVNNPVGTITVVNNTGKNVVNAKVSFFLKDYTDFPYDTVLRKVNADEEVVVPLKATLNNKVLQISEDTPIQAQFTVSYMDEGAEKTQTLNKPITILSRTAIVWDDAPRITSFVTPNDPPVRQLLAQVLPLVDKAAQDEDLPQQLRKVIMIWDALAEIGISYLADPTSPYAEVKANHSMPIDRVQFPRDTLKLKTGDCDDLTALLATMLEGVGVQTAIMDYPSHIALMANTGLNNSLQVGLPYHRLVQYADSLWVPLEPTMLGKPFESALVQAAATYNQSKEEVKIIETRKASKVFEAVTLPETDWAVQRPGDPALLARYGGDVKALGRVRFKYLTAYYEGVLKKTPDDTSTLNSLAIVYAQNGDPGKGKEYLAKVLAADPSDPTALNNMGNLAYSAGNYEAAADYYNKASLADPYDSDIWLNRARASYKLKNTAEAEEFVNKAVSLDRSAEETGYKLIHQD
ncbi:MAG: tetratricopeptide repeat protein [Elusimicrobia bacterium]|nr:tetratricopeptide repeat protein [Elusimicrobiota bacterium]